MERHKRRIEVSPYFVDLLDALETRGQRLWDARSNVDDEEPDFSHEEKAVHEARKELTDYIDAYLREMRILRRRITAAVLPGEILAPVRRTKVKT